MNGAPEKLGARFYRSQLGEKAAAAYDLLEAHCESKNYAPCVPLPVPGCTFDDAFAAYCALQSDRPDFFWLGSSVRWLPGGRLEMSVLYTPDEISRLSLLLRKYLCRLLRGTAGLPAVEAERLVYGRIAKRLHYIDHDDERDHNVVGPLLSASCVCEGANDLLLLCLRRLSIPCVKVSGRSARDRRHCWTIAWVDGEPAHCDVTWDLAPDGDVFFEYFNLSDRQIGRDHFGFESPALPRCTSEELGFYSAPNRSFSTQQDFSRFLMRRLRVRPPSPVWARLEFARTGDGVRRAVEEALSAGGPNVRVSIHSGLRAAVITPV